MLDNHFLDYTTQLQLHRPATSTYLHFIGGVAYSIGSEKHIVCNMEGLM